MGIFIINEEPDIYLTQSQYDRLMAEYRKAFMYFAGTPPSFEAWYRQRLSASEAQTTGGTK